MALGGYDGSIRIDTKVDEGGFKRGLKSIQSGLGSLKSSLGKLAGAFGLAFSIDQVVAFGKEAIQLASDLGEVQNVVDTAFGAMSGQVDEWAKNSIKQFGMSELSAKQMASTYMAMNAGVGMSDQGAADMAMGAVERAADIASFYNKSVEEAGHMMQSIWTGETESFKALGISMTQANLDEYALANGIGKTTQQMTQAEQVQLRYAYIMDRTNLAAGDFVKTQDSWANQTRILSEQWKQLLTILGGTLIQVLTPALKFLNEFMSILIGWAQQFSALVSAIFGKSVSQANTAVSSTQAAAGAQKELASATKQANKETKKQLASFDMLNVLQKDSESSGAPESPGASGGGAAIAVPALSGEIGADVKISPAVQQAADTIRGIFEKINIALGPTKAALQGLWGEFERLGGFVWSGLVDFYKTFLEPVGAWVMGEGIPRFITAIQNGMAQIDWQKINDSLHTLWVALAPFAINVGEGLLWLWENILVPLGTWMMNEIVPVFLERLAVGVDLANESIEIAKPGIQWLFDNFLKPIAKWTGGVIVSVLEGITDALEIFSDWCKQNEGLIQDIALAVGSFMAAWGIVKIASTIAGIVSALASFITTGGLATVVAGGLGAAIDLLTSPILLTILAIGALIAIVVLCVKHWDEIKAAALSCWEKIQEAWNAVVTWFYDTIVQPVADFFTGLWDGISNAASYACAVIYLIWSVVSNWFNDTVIKPLADFFTGLWDGISNTAASCWNAICKVWTAVSTWFYNTVVQPVVNFFTSLWNSVSNAAKFCWNAICAVWTVVSGWFNATVVQPVSGFFSGLWDGISSAAGKAWETICGVWESVAGWFETYISKPIEKGFKNTINGLLSMVEGFVNFFIDGINGVIKALNAFKVDIPDWPIFGKYAGKEFGLDISPVERLSIPRLAQGAVIPPNQQFLAMLGDQKSGTNVEAPLSTIEQAVQNVWQKNGGGQEITLRLVSDRGFVRNLKIELDKESQRRGVKLVRGGAY